MKNYLVILILLSNLVFITLREKPIKNFCGVDSLKGKIEIGKSPNFKDINSKTRRLSTDYTPIRIFLDITFLEEQIKNLPEMVEHQPKIKRALNKTIKSIGDLIKVIQITDRNVFHSMNETFFKKINVLKWDEKLNNTEQMSLNYDYILLARFAVDSDGLPETALAGAYPALLEEKTNRPNIGLMIISKNHIFFSKDNAEHYFTHTFFHEFTHALGFLSQGYQYFPGGEEKSILRKKDKFKIDRAYVITPKVMEFAKKYYGCEKINGVELENQGYGGSVLSHWESRILLGEYMTSEVYQDELYISEITLALLEDSGWYQVNYYTGGLMRFGKNKGCDFLNEFCVDKNGTTKFYNEYFSTYYSNYPGCTTGRQSRTYNIISYYTNLDNPNYSEILPNVSSYGNIYYIGGFMRAADYCPVFYHIENEYTNSYFVGHCKIGKDNYGSNIWYNNTGKLEPHSNSELPKELGEKYSENSFCMMSNLVPNGKYEIFGTIFHPMCFPSYCSSSSLTVLIYDQYIVCPRQGGNVKVEGYDGKIHCPDYNIICTGTVLCNDLFDCIEKKSMPKENTNIYDYEPLTTHNNVDIPNVKTIEAGELSDDGICPKNCMQCLEKKKCKLCLKGYNLIGVKENDDQPIICNNNTDINKGYYKKNNIYYPCHANCQTCSSGPNSDNEMNCIECKEGFELKDKNCVTKTKNYIMLISIIIGIVVAVLIVVGVLLIIRKKRKENLIDDNINDESNKEVPLY